MHGTQDSACLGQVNRLLSAPTAPERQRQEDHRFGASLGHIIRLCFEIKESPVLFMISSYHLMKYLRRNKCNLIKTSDFFSAYHSYSNKFEFYEFEGSF